MTIDDARAAFTPFADPATHFEVEQAAAGTRVQLIRDGSQKTFFIDCSTGTVRSRQLGGRDYVSIDSLLASPEFADLRTLASTQQRMLSEEAVAPYIEPNLSILGLPQGEPSIDLLSRTLSLPASARTKIVLLDGSAGVGKTRLLQRLTWVQAKAYLEGRGAAPLLYIGSRGARLSSLRAELAATTQRLRARVTYDQVPVLVRRGLLHLAIDGFDELVDADGYQDAWYALRDFLDELSGAGACILAGRDTFFDQQGFFDRLRSSHAQVELVQAHMSPVPPERARQWLRDRGWPEQEVNAPEAESVFQSDSYALRPYFLSVLAEAQGWEEVNRDASARAFLISRFLEREAKLVEDMVGIERPAARDAIQQMFEEAAKDMAERESTEVDVEYLAFLCEVVFEKLLSAYDLRKLQHKAGSFALLERGTSDRARRFPHSEVLHYFLARSILKELGGRSIPTVLRRGVLGIDFFEVFQELIEREPSEVVGGALSYLEGVLRDEITADRLPYNGAGLLLAALSRSLPTGPRKLADLAVNECSLTDQVAEAHLSNVDVYRLDARGADLSRVTFENCRVSVLVADSNTTLGVSAPTIMAVHFVRGGDSSALRATEEIRSWILRHTVAYGQDDDGLPLVRFFDRICRKAVRQFYLRQGGHDPGAELLEHPMWPEIYRILDEEGRVETRTPQAGGPAAVFFHIKGAQHLLAPPEGDLVSARVRDRVVERAKALDVING